MPTVIDWEVEGRHIRIADTSAFDPNLKRIAIQAIQDASREEHVFKHFPLLLIYLKDGVPGETDYQRIIQQSARSASVDENTALGGWAVLTVFIDVAWAASTREQRQLSEKIQEVVRHEMNHLFTYRENDALAARAAALKHLEKALDEYERHLAQYQAAPDAANALVALRKEHYQFIHALLLEGTARHAERFHGMAINPTTLGLVTEKGERAAWRVMEELNDRIALLARGQKQAGKLTTYAYDMGHAMVYTILYVHHEFALGQVEKLSPLKFIKMYEDSCARLGLRPVASYTSGAGIFDYKREVERWWQAARVARGVWQTAQMFS